MIRPRARWHLSLLALPVLAIAGCATPGTAAGNPPAAAPAATAQASPQVPLVAGALARRLDAMLAPAAGGGTATLAR